ncbi:MAG: histidine phosphatase family protein [Lachnospiraceae bacterium]|nr:histidine phosphatase family protein [Lachnospiraceae bacterium]
MYIYLVRHGETDWNQDGRIQGREDIELNENGMTQARALAEMFANIKLDSIASSPLLRAVETARTVARKQSLEQIETEEDLIERDYGTISGKHVRREEKQSLFSNMKIEGLECMEDVEERMLRIIRRYANKGYKHVLMISHGAAINSVLSVLSDREIGSGKTWLKNACINVLECEKDQLRIVRYNMNAEEGREYFSSL